MDEIFYHLELSKVICIVTDNKTYCIEKVLQKRGQDMLIKWLGWFKKFNSLIDKSD